MKNMKIIIIALLTCLTMSSCEKWFDVSPKSDVKSDDLFKDENGILGCIDRGLFDHGYPIGLR